MKEKRRLAVSLQYYSRIKASEWFELMAVEIEKKRRSRAVGGDICQPVEPVYVTIYASIFARRGFYGERKAADE